MYFLTVQIMMGLYGKRNEDLVKSLACFCSHTWYELDYVRVVY